MIQTQEGVKLMYNKIMSLRFATFYFEKSSPLVFNMMKTNHVKIQNISFLAFSYCCGF